MFERYTEQARRVLFFARYESSQFGSLSIDPEHLLLGLVRGGTGLVGRLLSDHESIAAIRTEVERQLPVHEKTSTSVEIPFSTPAKLALNYAAEEADRLLHRHIGPEHLLLGVLRVDGSIAESVLRQHGLRLEEVRGRIVALALEYSAPVDVPQAIARIRSLVIDLASATDAEGKQVLVEHIITELDGLGDRT